MGIQNAKVGAERRRRRTARSGRNCTFRAGERMMERRDGEGLQTLVYFTVEWK